MSEPEEGEISIAGETIRRLRLLKSFFLSPGPGEAVAVAFDSRVHIFGQTPAGELKHYQIRVINREGTLEEPELAQIIQLHFPEQLLPSTAVYSGEPSEEMERCIICESPLKELREVPVGRDRILRACPMCAGVIEWLRSPETPDGDPGPPIEAYFTALTSE